MSVGQASLLMVDDEPELHMLLRRKIEHNPDRPEVLKKVRNLGHVFSTR